MRQTLRLGVIGLGGFAQEHHRAIRELEQQGVCRLVSACDPDPLRRQSGAAEYQFAERAVRVFADYRELLASRREGLDLVTVPTPIPLHASMHQACIEAGVACYLEKPPTLYDRELNAMLTIEENAAKQTNVGFNFTIEEPRQQLKRRLLDGEFGPLRQVRLLGLWPRPDGYFRRSVWAGRLMLDNRPVLDSIFGNAMAHHVHNVLFWAGQKALFDWAAVNVVQAEMYRAHAIEGTDTLFASARAEGDIELRFALTHACDGPQQQREEVVCENATLTYIVGDAYRIRWRDGREETGSAARGDLFKENLAAYIRYVQGDAERPLNRLSDCRPFVHFNTLAYVAAGAITSLSEENVTITQTTDGSVYRAINEIESATTIFLRDAIFPSAQGLQWGRPGGSAADSEREKLLPVLKTMQDATRFPG